MNIRKAVKALLTTVTVLALQGCGKSPPVSLFPLISDEEIAQGKSLYNSNCKMCHGTPSRGNLPVFSPLANSPVVIGDALIFSEHILYDSNHRKGEEGPYFFTSYDDASITRIANYLRQEAGLSDQPLRARTVKTAREVHDEKLKGKETPKLPEEN